MGWKLPTLVAILWVVALFVLGAVLGALIGGLPGTVLGAIPGALAAVVAGFIPVLREDSRRHRDELASLQDEAAVAQESWDAIGEPTVDIDSVGPTYLLRPSAQVVAFCGRQEELEALRSWRNSTASHSVRIIVAAGGMGKTRLALEVATECQSEGWEWRLVAQGREADAVAAARAVTSGPVLLIADYAETRPGLEAMLTAVLADPGRLCVLLVARSLGEWWDRLVEKSPAAIGALLTEAAPLRLTEPISAGVADLDLARAAVPYFAKAVGAAIPDNLVFDLPDHRVPVLVLHAAALLAVLRFGQEPARELRLVIGDGVLEELLEHEARYWRRSAGAAGLREEGAVLKPFVAAAALLGAGSPGEAADIALRVPDLAELPTADRRRWGRWVYELYPADSFGQLGSLQPDLVSETFVVRQLAASREFARACMDGLTEVQAERALTVLARAQAHQDQAADIIAQALAADLAHLAIPAARVALQTSSALAPLLEAAVRAAPISSETLMVITVALPYPSVTLAHTRLAAAQRVLGSLRPDVDPVIIAEWKNRVGTMLTELGRPSEALPVIRNTIDVYRELSKADPASFRPMLARALNNLGSILYRLGRPAEALPAAEEAAAIRRDLAAEQPLYQADLAQSLSNLGTALAGLGRFSEAVIPAQEALQISRQLASSDPDYDHQHLVVQSLTNLSIWCSELGDHAGGIAFANESVAISRTLAKTNPDRYEPDLAHCLGNLATHLANMGCTPEALETSLESTAIYQRLNESKTGSYQLQLASSLTNLGSRFTELGEPRKAADATGKALALYQQLADINPGSHDAETALCLSNLGAQIARTDHPAEAREYTEQAVALYRKLANANPDLHSSHLAQSLYNLSQRLRNTGHPAEAIPPLEEAIAIRRRLTRAKQPARQVAALAHCLNNLSALLAQLGNMTAALAAIEEAVPIYRALADIDPIGYKKYLANSLMLQGSILLALGRDTEAQISAAEADELLEKPKLTEF